jgi:phosphate starvation-inducible PhoH-like protein
LSEKTIIIEDVNPVDLFGVNNERLKIFQARFPKLKFVLRGSDLKVQGDNDEIANFSSRLEMLIAYVKRYGQLREEHLTEILGDFSVDRPVNGEPAAESDTLVFGPHGKIIRARTANQKKMVEYVKDNDILFAIGPAGTGKTYTAVAIAVRALKNKEVKRIILARPAVEAGENLGFLPGDLKEKIDPYLRPLYDALDDMIPPDKLKVFLENRTIEIAPMAFMRGRTLDHAYIILDEAQNATNMQLKMFLTRMGPHAKCIITGDLTQIDLPKKQQSGLIQAVKLLDKIKGIKMCYLTVEDVVRHRLVKEIIKAYEHTGEQA